MAFTFVVGLLCLQIKGYLVGKKKKGLGFSCYICFMLSTFPYRGGWVVEKVVYKWREKVPKSLLVLWKRIYHKKKNVHNKNGRCCFELLPLQFSFNCSLCWPKVPLRMPMDGKTKASGTSSTQHISILCICFYKYPIYESHLNLWQNYGKQNLILPDFEGKFTEISRLK